MKKYILATLIIFSAGITFGQTFNLVDAESKVTFFIKNFGLKTEGEFKGLKGTIVFDPNNLGNSILNAMINAATINTDNNARDKHLRKADYFNTEKFPQISFTSTKISKTSVANIFNTTGNLTIKGTTKTIDFNFVATPSSNGYLLKGEFVINRRDFKVGGNSISLSDNLTVLLEVKAVKN